MSEFRMPPLENLATDVTHASMAKTFVERLEGWIKGLQSRVPPGKQLSVRVLLSGIQPMPVKFIGYHNPNLVAIEAYNLNGEAVTLLAHQNTVQLLCEMVPVEGDKPRQHIGFQTGA